MCLNRKRNIIIFAMILGICVIIIGSKVFYKHHSEQKAKNRLIENPFSGINQEINLQSGNYQGNTKALVVDGYVYFYKSRVYLGNYDHADELEKCGNNVIYRLSPDGVYEEFYTFDYGDAIYYDIRSKLYYYDGYFYVQIENRIYRIDKEGTNAQIIYENMGEGHLEFGIRDHYLVLQKVREYFYMDLDKWDWSQRIEVGRMRHLFNIDVGLADLYGGIIYGTGKELPNTVIYDEQDYELQLYDVEEKVWKEIEASVHCVNIYKGDIFFAEREDDSSVCIKYISMEGESEEDLFTINLDTDANIRVKSLVVSDDYIVYDLGPKEYYGGVDKRVVWNRHTGETQQAIEYQ